MVSGGLRALPDRCFPAVLRHCLWWDRGFRQPSRVLPLWPWRGCHVTPLRRVSVYLESVARGARPPPQVAVQSLDAGPCSRLV